MASGTLEASSTADRLPVTETLISENGTLVGLTAVVTVGTPEKGQLFVEAGVMKGGIGGAFKAAVAIKSYAYLANPIFWWGKLQLEPGDRIYLEVRGAEVYTVRLTNFVMLEGG